MMMRKTKTIKTPSADLKFLQNICVKRQVCGFESELFSHSHASRHNHWRGSIPQKEKQKKPRVVKACFMNAEVHPEFAGTAKYRFAKKHDRFTIQVSGNKKRFSWFFLDEKESLKGITVFAARQSGCLHTSSIGANGVNTLTRVSFSARGF